VEPGILPYTSYACSIQRWCGGEGQWKTHFVNESKDAAIIGLTPNRPGKVRRRKNEWALKCECVRPSCLCLKRSPLVLLAHETFETFSGARGGASVNGAVVYVTTYFAVAAVVSCVGGVPVLLTQRWCPSTWPP
jgi:hypothetical protein